MQAKTGQRLQLLPRPLDPLRHKPFGRRQHRIGLRLGANTPQQTLGLQPRPATGATRRVTAVLGQQHPDVHLVGLGLQIRKEPVDAKPVLVPLAIPVGRTVDDPTLLLGRELVPGCVTRNPRRLGVAHQVVLALLPRGCLHRLDRPRAQGEFVVRDDQTQVHAHYAAKAPTGLAGAHGRVKGKHRRNRVGVAQIALRAVQPGREAPDNRVRFCY